MKEDSAIIEGIRGALRIKGHPVVFLGSAGLIFAFVVFGTLFADAAGKLFGEFQSVISSRLGWFYPFYGDVLPVCSASGSVSADTAVSDSVAMTSVRSIGMLHLVRDVVQRRHGHRNALLVSRRTDHAFRQPAGRGRRHAGSGGARHGYHPSSLGASRLVRLRRCGSRIGLRRLASWAPAHFPVRSSTLFSGSAFTEQWGTASIFSPCWERCSAWRPASGWAHNRSTPGWSYLLGFEVSMTAQLLVIAGITLMATISVLSGLDRGICWLSRIAIWLAVPLLVYILIAGPTGETLRSAVEDGAHYLMTIGRQGFWASLGGSTEWQGDWTMFYWAWWIAWSPFVGMFVARISRGRTVREFVLGVLLVPTAVTCVWFSVFGGIALDRVISVVTKCWPLLFRTISQRPSSCSSTRFRGQLCLSVAGVFIIVLFFITSSDSASLVVDYIAAGGDQHAPKRQRAFWATMEGMVAAVLLVGGGLAPMRAFQLIMGLPLAVILLADLLRNCPVSAEGMLQFCEIETSPLPLSS